MIVAMNLLVVGVGAVVGWVGIEVAGRAIEHRLIDEAVSNAAGLAGEMRLPLSNALMSRLGQILGAEAAAGPADRPGIVASSLDPGPTRQLAEALGAARPRRVGVRRIVLDEVGYRVGSAVVSQPTPRFGILPKRGPIGPGSAQGRAEPGTTPRPAMRLYLLVPESQVHAAKRQAAWTIALITLAAILLATALAFWISTTISRPVRGLADRMDHLADPPLRHPAETGANWPRFGPGTGRAEDHALQPGPRLAGAAATDAAGPPARRPGVPNRPLSRSGAPVELARLEGSFDQLLGRLAAARTQLARSARLATLGQLAASVAHELRNPLSGIKMNARVLADALSAAGIADKSLELIIREIDRMDVYLQELLSLSVSSPEDDPEQQPAFQDVRLDALADSAVSLLAGRCGHAGVTVEQAYDVSAGAVRGDPAQLRQVILNLMLNALDAMPHGGSIALGLSASQGHAVRFSVSDTGAGVHVPDNEDLFDPFVTTKPGGTGLGLAICRRVISRHGGRIGYDSARTGSTFWFELPAAG